MHFSQELHLPSSLKKKDKKEVVVKLLTFVVAPKNSITAGVSHIQRKNTLKIEKNKTKLLSVLIKVQAVNILKRTKQQQQQQHLPLL